MRPTNLTAWVTKVCAVSVFVTLWLWEGCVPGPVCVVASEFLPELWRLMGVSPC